MNTLKSQPMDDFSFATSPAEPVSATQEVAAPASPDSEGTTAANVSPNLGNGCDHPGYTSQRKPSYPTYRRMSNTIQAGPIRNGKFQSLKLSPASMKTHKDKFLLGLQGISPSSLRLARTARELAKRSLTNERELNVMRIAEYHHSIQFLESLNKDHDLSLGAIELQIEYIDEFQCCKVGTEQHIYNSDGSEHCGSDGGHASDGSDDSEADWSIPDYVEGDGDPDSDD